MIAAGPLSLSGALTARGSWGEHCHMWLAPPSVVGQQLALQTTGFEFCCMDLCKIKFLNSAPPQVVSVSVSCLYFGFIELLVLLAIRRCTLRTPGLPGELESPTVLFPPLRCLWPH